MADRGWRIKKWSSILSHPPSSSCILNPPTAILEGNAVRREFNVLALLKGKERYVFVYDDQSRQSLIDSFRDQAADPQLSFNWFDAAILTEKARAQVGRPLEALPPSRPRV
jgi:hypothetical protein